jgi:uncharacterized protein (DUF362 family)
MPKPIDRREFIKTAAVAGASLAFLPETLSGSDSANIGAGQKSRVVEVSSPGVVGADYRPYPDGLRSMVELGVKRLSGEDDLAKAWKHFVKPDDVVGIKINSWGGRQISSKKPIIQAVVDGVQMVGVPPSRIVVWEQYENNLQTYVRQQRVERDMKGIRFEACSTTITKEQMKSAEPFHGFDTDPVRFPWGEVRVAELVARRLTAIINLPVLKDHITGGMSGALKNISHAVVDRPWICHDNFCNPHIADIVNIPVVRDKLRLHILDGVLGVAAGGPALHSLDHLLVDEKLLFSTDPVAVDWIGYGWIDRARAERGLPPIEKRTDGAPGLTGIPGAYLATAAARGLGSNDPKRIELISVANSWSPPGRPPRSSG